MKKHLLNLHIKYANSGGVFRLKTRVHYSEEIKWKVIQMKKNGYSNRTIIETLGIKNTKIVCEFKKNQTTYPLKNIGNRWFRYFDMCSDFGGHFKKR